MFPTASPRGRRRRPFQHLGTRGRHRLRNGYCRPSSEKGPALRGEVSCIECGGPLVQEVFRVSGWGGPSGGSRLGKSVVTTRVGPGAVSGWGQTRQETHLHRAVRSSCGYMWLRVRWGVPPHSSPGTGCRHAPGELHWVSCPGTL